jgi:hypothetical protein
MSGVTKPDWILTLFSLIAQWSDADPEWEDMATSDEEFWTGTRVMVSYAPLLVIPEGRSGEFYLNMAEALAGLAQFMRASPSSFVSAEQIVIVWGELAERLVGRAIEADVPRRQLVRAARSDRVFANCIHGAFDSYE